MHHRTTTITAVAALLLTATLTACNSTPATPHAPATSSAPSKDVATAAAEDQSPTPTYDEVTADSFKIKLRTTKRHCFGSAGCNVTVEPNLTYLGDTESIDPHATYEITYEIHGDESGPVIETAELTDRTSLNYRPSDISTASGSTKVSVKITDVTTQGG